MFCVSNLRFEAKYVSDHYLRDTGSMVLLCTRIGSDIINLIILWRSDEMLNYLGIQAKLPMKNFSQLIIMHGNYYFLPQQ